MTTPPKDKAIQRLQRALDAIEDLKQSKRRSSSPEFKKWHRDTKIAIARTFGEDSSQMKDLAGISYLLSDVTHPLNNVLYSQDVAPRMGFVIPVTLQIMVVD